MGVAAWGEAGSGANEVLTGRWKAIQLLPGKVTTNWRTDEIGNYGSVAHLQHPNIDVKSHDKNQTT